MRTKTHFPLVINVVYLTRWKVLITSCIRAYRSSTSVPQSGATYNQVLVYSPTPSSGDLTCNLAWGTPFPKLPHREGAAWWEGSCSQRYERLRYCTMLFKFAIQWGVLLGILIFTLLFSASSLAPKKILTATGLSKMVPFLINLGRIILAHLLL